MVARSWPSQYGTRSTVLRAAWMRDLPRTLRVRLEISRFDVRGIRRAAMDDGDVDANASSAAVVEAGWRAVRADGRVRPELLEAAYADLRLRQLFPWTGMGEL